ncbi:VOC family protein [Cellulomonas carbonis]|uniref:3-demethylubiquinone-9 3-methyltransferase n=1 Tax=Cellulomonas carbonis T26 TaxID=947969 RepID=A0A0A0BR65_9CELL|nr:VOC family protein [Cellulomonas carbonis]KGM10963.1 3-demethylubiquinone-9 3-methyltransferase [Cellulomonas carbonis T26]GGC02510.1 VOC family protein [Cellulomonas carbonis]
MTVQMNPYLGFRSEAREALTFYASVFGGEPTFSTFSDYGMNQGPDDADRVMHGQLETAAGFVLMAADTPSGMERTQGNAFSVSLSGGPEDDAALRGYWEKLSEGAQIGEQLTVAPWGDAFGMLTDRFGVEWMVNIGGAANAGGDGAAGGQHATDEATAQI